MNGIGSILSGWAASAKPPEDETKPRFQFKTKLESSEINRNYVNPKKFGMSSRDPPIPIRSFKFEHTAHRIETEPAPEFGSHPPDVTPKPLKKQKYVKKEKDLDICQLNLKNRDSNSTNMTNVLQIK